MFCRHVFQLELIDYEQLIKIKKNRRVIGKKKLPFIANPLLMIPKRLMFENFNSVLREHLDHFVKGVSKCFSKAKRRLVCSVLLFGFYWNFINVLRRGFSPAKLEGLSDYLWSWHEFPYFK